MQPNEKANEKINPQLSTQPKKTWEDPAMARLDINSGKYYFDQESSFVAGTSGTDYYYFSPPN